MRSARGRPSTAAPALDGSARPLERAQLVWQRAVNLSGPAENDDWFRVVLDLMRTARHGPATMLHALALGRAQQRAHPGDNATRNAVQLLTRAVAWMGKRTDDGEVGTLARGQKAE
jgi:hypothetical protein